MSARNGGLPASSAAMALRDDRMASRSPVCFETVAFTFCTAVLKHSLNPSWRAWSRAVFSLYKAPAAATAPAPTKAPPMTSAVTPMLSMQPVANSTPAVAPPAPAPFKSAPPVSEAWTAVSEAGSGRWTHSSAPAQSEATLLKEWTTCSKWADMLANMCLATLVLPLLCASLKSGTYLRPASSVNSLTSSSYRTARSRTAWYSDVRVMMLSARSLSSA
mmetsp:Transcript_42646/g.115013  ORF Transcript_42646/g.115013 Transcript_42646/m.115013 type:complete len:218 (-) Transcript_42646:211-864(-)